MQSSAVVFAKAAFFKYLIATEKDFPQNSSHFPQLIPTFSPRRPSLKGLGLKTGFEKSTFKVHKE